MYIFLILKFCLQTSTELGFFCLVLIFLFFNYSMNFFFFLLHQNLTAVIYQKHNVWVYSNSTEEGKSSTWNLLKWSVILNLHILKIVYQTWLFEGSIYTPWKKMSLTRLLKTFLISAESCFSQIKSSDMQHLPHPENSTFSHINTNNSPPSQLKAIVQIVQS